MKIFEISPFGEGLDYCCARAMSALRDTLPNVSFDGHLTQESCVACACRRSAARMGRVTEVGFEYLYSDGMSSVAWVGIIDDPDPEAEETNRFVQQHFEAQFARETKRRRRYGTIIRKIKRQVSEIEYFDD